MKIEQMYDLVNTATKEVLGEEAVVNEDLSNIVDIGNAILGGDLTDPYSKALVNRIGKVIFVNRLYQGGVPKVLMDDWEFGSIVEKVHGELPEAEENETYELVDGASYDQNIFYGGKFHVKFYNQLSTFQIPKSFTEKQLKQSFLSVTELNAFLSMIYTDIENSLTIKIEALIMSTISTLIAETMAAEYPTLSDYETNTSVKAVNLLKEYNDMVTAGGGTGITVDEALYNREFLRFASRRIGLTVGRMKKMSTLFNVGGTPKFTPEDRLNVVLLEDFTRSADSYLSADTFHDSLVKLPGYETVPYWQGSGTSYDFEDISTINVKTPSGKTVEVSGILGIVSDREACGVRQPERRVTTHYNAKADFFTNYYKFESRYFIDLNENAVVFYIAEGE